MWIERKVFIDNKEISSTSENTNKDTNLLKEFTPLLNKITSTSVYPFSKTISSDIISDYDYVSYNGNYRVLENKLKDKECIRLDIHKHIDFTWNDCIVVVTISNLNNNVSIAISISNNEKRYRYMCHCDRKDIVKWIPKYRIDKLIENVCIDNGTDPLHNW